MSDDNKSVKAIVAEKLIKLGESLLEPKKDEKKPLNMMADGVLTDGTRIATPADAWAEGVEIFVEVEGEMTPLAPGEYTLEDGTVLVVEQEGVLNEIKPAEQPAEEPAEPTEAVKDDEKKDKSYMDEQKVKAIVETLVKEYKFASHEQIETVQKENTELKETIVMLSEALEELSKPYEAKKKETEPTKKAAVEMRDASKLEGEARFAAIRERYHSIN